MATKKRVLHKLKLDEISGVDSMAQAGAKMVLMKRDDSIAKGAFKDALFVMETKQSLNEAYWALWDSDETLRIAIYNIMDNPSRYPDSQVAIIEAVKEYSDKAQEQVAEAAAAVSNKGDDNSSPDDPTEKSDHSIGNKEPENRKDKTVKNEPKNEPTVETITAEKVAVEAKLAKAEAFGKLNDAEKTHLSSLDEAGQEEFMKMDDNSRASILEKAVEDNPVIYTANDGSEFRKSDDPRMVKMAKDHDSDRKLLKKEREEREVIELTKRSEDELNNLPGDTEVKVALLKAIGSVTDEGTRDKINEMLKAGNDAQSAAFNPQGTSTPASGDANDKLNVLAKAYGEKHEVSFHKAYVAVLETDEGQELYSQTQA